MRLQKCKSAAVEELTELLNKGYGVLTHLNDDYRDKTDKNTFKSDEDNKTYESLINDWLNNTIECLRQVFPTDLETNYFLTQPRSSKVFYFKIDEKFAGLTDIIPKYINRLQEILDRYLPRYTDLPIKDRLYIEDIDSFRNVRDVNPAMVDHHLEDGYLDLPEDQVQLALEQILDVPFHKKDWGGEVNDLYTANLIINGSRTSSAFLLKGHGLKKKELHISDCGKNGDQIVRLLESPATLFVVQFIGRISEMVIKDLTGKVAVKLASGKLAKYLIMDGQDTARLLFAYKKLDLE